jgi:hypothetical protein
VEALYKMLLLDLAEFEKLHPNAFDPSIKSSEIQDHRDRIITLCALMLIGPRREFIARMITTVHYSYLFTYI